MKLNTGHREERGITLPLTALSIVVLFAMAALAIDLGVAYTARTSAQHAADSAALAGVSTFVFNTSAPQPATAQQAAIAMAAQNKILGRAVAITAANVVVQNPDRVAGTPARVTVTVPRTGVNGVATYFARVIGWNTLNVVAVARAEASTSATGTSCLKPIFVPNTMIAPSTITRQAACNTPRQALLNDDGSLTDATRTLLASSNRGPYVIRPVGGSGSSLAPSQYFSIDYGSGGSTYRCTLGGCMTDCGINPSQAQAFCGGRLSTETGNMSGPTNQGVNDLIGNPATYSWDSPGRYCNGSGQCFDTAPNVAVAPIWNDCAETISSGRQTFPVVGFALVFIDGANGGGDVTAHLINVMDCRNGGGGSPGGPSGPLGAPIRLVKYP